MRKSRSASSKTSSSTPESFTDQTITGTVPIPATVLETVRMDTPAAVSVPVLPAAGKGRPFKVTEAKVIKWIEGLKKAKEVSPTNKFVGTVLGGLEALVSQKNNAASGKSSSRHLSEYNIFVQENIKQVAAQNPNLSNKEVMVLIAKLWQEHKAATGRK
jgi:HMG (high mobility group) box